MNRRQFLAAAGAFAVQHRLDIRRFDLTSGNLPAVAVRQPYVQNVRRDRAVIMWATQSPGVGYVSYSPDGVTYKNAPALARTFLPSETLLTAPFTQFTAVLPHLLPGTTYVYNPFVNTDIIGPGGTFQTAPADGSRTFRFLVLGDSGMGTGAQASIAQQLSSE